MSSQVRSLHPTTLWNHFANLNEVPRPSKKEERVIKFMEEFGHSLGLETLVDHIGNVIIKKPASQGFENRQTIVLQSHLDMVHQKNSATNFDFSSEGIKMLVEGDWVRADGTTLGADNGIGVAAIMTILSSNDIQHPPIEALFTIDEETGMTGAMELKGGLLDGSILLNLDTEDDDELTIGCAGGIDVNSNGVYTEEDLSGAYKIYKLGVKGLTGGHSGMDIHLGRGNANKIMNRLLLKAVKDIGLKVGTVDGGGLRNAIPRESFSIVAIPESSNSDFLHFIQQQREIIINEYKTTDPNCQVVIESTDYLGSFASESFIQKFLRCIYACPNGIYRMSPDIPDLVQTSNNLARVLMKDGEFAIQCLTRGSVDSEKDDLAETIKAAFELCGATVKFEGSYPGWAPVPDSDIVKIMSDLYTEMFEDQANVNACHAGLECGILGTNYPHIQMISFGPNIRGAHSPDEKVQVSSVQKFWGFLLETLQRIPLK